MMLKLVFIYICYLAASTSSREYEVGYYWLDYTGGNMSQNALRVAPGNDVYVGQVYIRNFELLTAQVRTSFPFATTLAYAQQRTSNTNIKVLCSQYLEGFQWVQSTASAYRSIPNLILGGEENGISSYFARVFVNNTPILGKLRNTMTYFIGSTRYENDGPFEVLTYTRPGNRTDSAVDDKLLA